MDLHIAHPGDVVQLHFGVEEVRAGVGVVYARRDDAELFAVRGRPFRLGVELVFPRVVKDLFLSRHDE